MAHERIEKMKKETGRITNVELQRKVTESLMNSYRLSRNLTSYPVMFAKLLLATWRTSKLFECSCSFLIGQIKIGDPSVNVHDVRWIKCI